MPDFPRYQSKGQLTTEKPAAPLAENTSAEVMGEVAKAGANLMETSVKWMNAMDTIQKTTSKANFKSGILDVLQKAEQDPDYNNSDQYLKEIDKLKEKSLVGFNSKTAQNDADRELSYDSKVAQIQIQNMYKKKVIDVGQASTLKLLDMEVGNPREGFDQNVKSIIDKQVKAGVYSHEDGYKLKQQYVKEGKFNSFLRDFRNDPVATEKKFENNEYGMDIETSEKARSKLKELKTLQKEQEGGLFGELGLRAVSGDLTETEVMELIEANEKNPNEGITKAHGIKLIDSMRRDISKRINAKEYGKYKKALDFVFSNAPQEKIKGYEAVLEAYDGGITADESKYLKKILDTKKDIVFANRAAAGKKFLETLFGAKAKDVVNETQSLLSYSKRIADGADPDAAARATALDIIQEEHPAAVADPDVVAVFTPSKGFKNIPKVKRESSS